MGIFRRQVWPGSPPESADSTGSAQRRPLRCPAEHFVLTSFDSVNDAVAAPPTTCTWLGSGWRTAGDILIKYHLARGGTVPALGFHRWVTSGAPSAVCEAANS